MEKILIDLANRVKYLESLQQTYCIKARIGECTYVIDSLKKEQDKRKKLSTVKKIKDLCTIIIDNKAIDPRTKSIAVKIINSKHLDN